MTTLIEVRFDSETATESGIVDRVFKLGARAWASIGEYANHAVGTQRIELLLLTYCHFDHGAGANAFASKLHCAAVARELHRSVLERRAERVTTAKE